MRANRGELATVTLLVDVLLGVLALFVPNPISTAVGIGNRQNKIETSDTVTLINDKEGVPVAYRHIVKESDTQQKIGFWEWLFSLPLALLLLSLLGGIFPFITVFLLKLIANWKSAFKNTYDGLRSLRDTTVICRKCGDTVTIDTKEHVFNGVELKQDKRDKVLQEKVRTELVK